MTDSDGGGPNAIGPDGISPVAIGPDVIGPDTIGPDAEPLPIRSGAFAPPPSSFWQDVGGRPTFERLVRAFYAGVASDPPLLALYPEQDLEPAIHRLTGFLEQYWGGPSTYSEQRGHPRLRMRHMPFAVTFDARDRWLTHMRAAVDTLHLPPLQEQLLWDYLERAAHAMVNA